MTSVKRPYRADIDGLRAIAVMAVILFHLNIRPFTGGFVGVDVFFVISGYLITGIIVREMDEGRFSILRFYERRARRIAPALFGVVIAALVVGYMLFMPADLIALGKSALATLFMVANIFWWNDVDYFAAPPDTKPLLHMWSLGVEEQFYLFLPLILWFLSGKNLRRFRPYILSALLLVSLIACIIITRENASLAFFWLPFRAWELLIGGMLVFLPRSDRLPAEVVSILSTLGLITLCIPIFLLHHHSTFPGSNALTPVLGTAVVIWAGSGRQPLASRLLSLAPFMWIGLISYSLYLWHWPIIVFMRYWLMEPLSIHGITVALVLTFICASLSYLYIEQPFRSRDAFSMKAIFGWTGAGIALLSGIGLVFIINQGMPARLPPEVLRYANAGKITEQISRQNIPDSMPVKTDSFAAHYLGKPADKPSFLVWGDSFSGAFAYGINRQAYEDGQSGVLFSVAACMPILGLGAVMESTHEDCTTLQATILDEIDRLQPDTIILISNWGMIDFESLFRWVVARPQKRFVDTVEAAFDHTIAELRKRHLRIVIVSTMPTYKVDIPRVLARSAFAGRKREITMSMAELDKLSEVPNRLFDKYRNASDIVFVNPADILCKSGQCITQADGQPLYFDAIHLSPYGALLLAPLFKPYLKPVVAH